MRLDKYLKLSRLIKRIEVSKVLIEEGSVKVNDKVVKPSYEIKVDDIVLLKLGRRLIKVRCLSLDSPRNKDESNNMYKLINVEFDKC